MKQEVDVSLTKEAAKQILVANESLGINALPKWLKHCRTCENVENAVSDHNFDFVYASSSLLVIAMVYERTIRESDVIPRPFMKVLEG